MQHFLFAFSLGLGVVIFTHASHSQNQNCAPRDTIVGSLEGKYGETRQAYGLGQNQRVIEIFAAETTGSWTILATFSNGLSCMLAAGNAFEAEQKTPKSQDDPT